MDQKIETPVVEELEFHPRYDGFQYVSSVDVDAGCIWVGDPCYVLKDPGEARPADLGANWGDICSRFFERSGYDAARKAYRERRYEAREALQNSPEYKERFDAYLAAVKDLDKEAAKKAAQEFLAWEEEQENAWLDANPFDDSSIDKGFANFTHDGGHGGMGTMLNTNFGDGTYPIYIKYGKNGRPSQVLIDFLAGDAEYTELVDLDDCHLMTVDEFKKAVESGSYIDDDGDGYPVSDGKMDSEMLIRPSEAAYAIPDDATHIAWFNR